MIEKGQNEALPEQGFFKSLRKRASNMMSNPQNGLLNVFITIMIVGLILLLLYLSWTPGALPLVYAYTVSEERN